MALRHEIRAAILDKVRIDASVCARCVAKKLRTSVKDVRATIEDLRADGYAIRER